MIYCNRQNLSELKFQVKNVTVQHKLICRKMAWAMWRKDGHLAGVAGPERVWGRSRTMILSSRSILDNHEGLELTLKINLHASLLYFHTYL